jgi:hypothetical protein
MSIHSIMYSIRIPVELLAAMRDAAHRERKSLTQFILDLVRDKLNRMGYRLTRDSYKFNANRAEGIDIKRKRPRRYYD